MNNPGAFCYICGYFDATSFVKRAYKVYFGLTLGDQDKKWIPHIVCHNCEEILHDWTKGKQKTPTTDCYIYPVNTNERQQEKRT